MSKVTATTEESSAVGNAAAMREALEAIKKEAETTWEYRDYPIAGAPGERGTCPVVDADWIIDACKAALAAPARNCDLPLVLDGPANNNADKVWLVFKHRNPDAYFDVSGLLRCIDWLLAPVAGQKGEGDGRK